MAQISPVWTRARARAAAARGARAGGAAAPPPHAAAAADGHDDGGPSGTSGAGWAGLTREELCGAGGGF
jgi:hypothetical protein